MPVRPEERIEHAMGLDRPAAVAAGLVAPLGHGPAREVLSGRALRIGHALHPLLTDLPIGFWTSSWVLDLIGGPDAREVSQQLIGLGLLAAVPTAMAGWSDWVVAQEDDAPLRRVGVVHAACNVGATSAYLLSWRSRRRDHHRAGVAWGQLGAALATVGGQLGGHLAFGLDHSG